MQVSQSVVKSWCYRWNFSQVWYGTFMELYFIAYKPTQCEWINNTMHNQKPLSNFNMCALSKQNQDFLVPLFDFILNNGRLVTTVTNTCELWESKTECKFLTMILFRSPMAVGWPVTHRVTKCLLSCLLIKIINDYHCIWLVSVADIMHALIG